MPTPTEVAEAHYAAQTRQGEAAALLARRLWRGMSGDLEASWAKIAKRLTLLVGAAQLGAAKAGLSYVPEALDFDPQVDGEVNPNRWAGVASDGRDLDSLLYSAVVRARTHLGNGDPLPQALDAGRKWLDTLVRTQVADAGRGAAGVAIAARQQVGYVRYVSPPCCQRCAVLAGKKFRWNTGFQRHPKCFPAGVVVSGPGVNSATRRWYEGELVVLTTASGQNLPLTGNHPVLTRRGWVPAHLLQEGDEILRSTFPQGAAPLVVPDHHQVPSLIEDVWGSLLVGGLDRVPSSSEDFHGDGQHGEVDVVHADGSLWDRPLSLRGEHPGETALALGGVFSGGLDRQRVPEFGDLWHLAQAGGSVGGAGLGLAFVGGGSLVSDDAGFAWPSALHLGLAKYLGDRVAGDAVSSREFQHGHTRVVEVDHLVARNRDNEGPRWDAPALPFAEETRAGYASSGLDLLQRIASQVEADRLVEVRRTQWSGHVFSLSTDEGWHSANSLIVSNCDCRHLPAREDESPAGYKADIDPTDVRDLTAHQRQAISDGADMNQVINSHRANSRTKSGLYTSEGATRKGIPKRRLTPEGIYRLTGGNREKALELLKQHGYLR